MSKIAEAHYGDTPAPYPKAPGFTEPTTSKDAAKKMTSTAHGLRFAVLAELERGDGTADEVADRLGQSVLAIRPRMTELKAQGKIERTTIRRPNASGMSAWVMRIRRTP